MTADDIWRQIRSLARLKIRNAIAERRKKDRKAMDDLLVNADRNLPELTVFQPGHSVAGKVSISKAAVPRSDVICG